VAGRRGGDRSAGVRGDFRERSESNTKQFVVYSTDVRLRQRVASYARS